MIKTIKNSYQNNNTNKIHLNKIDLKQSNIKHYYYYYYFLLLLVIQKILN